MKQYSRPAVIRTLSQRDFALKRESERLRNPAEPCEFCGLVYEESQLDKERMLDWATDAAKGSGSDISAAVLTSSFHEVSVIAARYGTERLRLAAHECWGVRFTFWSGRGAGQMAETEPFDEPDFRVRKAMWLNPLTPPHWRDPLTEEFA